MKKKAALELSVNFIVVIIISLVIFTFGVSFVYNIMSNSNELRDMTMEDLDRRISDLMCGQTDKICVGEDRAVLRPGDLNVFPVRVLNVGINPPEFKLKLEKGRYIDSSNTMYETNDPAYPAKIPTFMPEERTETIKQNEAKTVGFGFELPEGVKKGTYIYNLEVYTDDGPGNFDNKYDSTQKLYIEVR